MYQMSEGAKLCATCEYWIGPRQPNYIGSHVELEQQSVKGKCFCYGGPHMRSERLSNMCACSRYEKWSVLKNP